MEKSTLFTNAIVYVPHDRIEQCNIVVRKGRIETITTDPISQSDHIRVDEVIDVGGRALIPGFIDIHVHGGGGYDVMKGRVEDIVGMCAFHAARGTTSILPTTITSDRKSTENAVKSIVEAMEMGTGGAEIVGIHLEGPFINKKRCGAQNPQYIRKGTIEELQTYIDLSKGNIRLITLAPEEPEHLDLIRYAVQNGVTVSIGHSDATYDIVHQAVKCGASHITHLFNGMSPLHHREPGVAGAAMMLKELTVELICDGFHVRRELIDFVFRVKTKDGIVLITDAISAAGLPDGDDYELGGLPCYLRHGQFRLKSTHDLAGSCLTMDQALRNTIEFTHRPLEEILPTLTINPARQVGIADRKGSIEVGKDADLVMLDEHYNVLSTYVKGIKVFGL